MYNINTATALEKEKYHRGESHDSQSNSINSRQGSDPLFRRNNISEGDEEEVMSDTKPGVKEAKIRGRDTTNSKRNNNNHHNFSQYSDFSSDKENMPNNHSINTNTNSNSKISKNSTNTKQTRTSMSSRDRDRDRDKDHHHKRDRDRDESNSSSKHQNRTVSTKIVKRRVRKPKDPSRSKTSEYSSASSNPKNWARLRVKKSKINLKNSQVDLKDF